MTGDSAHAPRGRIVHDAAKERHGGISGCARPDHRPASLGWSDSRSPRLRRQERRFHHRERIEDVCLRVPIQTLAGDKPDDVAEEKEVDIAVHKALAGGGGRRFVGRPADGFVGARELDLELEVRPQPGRMREQMPDGDAVLAVPGELGNEMRNRVGLGRNERKLAAQLPNGSAQAAQRPRASLLLGTHRAPHCRGRDHTSSLARMPAGAQPFLRAPAHGDRESARWRER